MDPVFLYQPADQSHFGGSDRVAGRRRRVRDGGDGPGAQSRQNGRRDVGFWF